MVGNFTDKHVAGSLGGAAATIAVPNAMRLRGWNDVMASSAVSIGGGIDVETMDEGAGGDPNELLNFGDITDLSEEVIETM